MGRLNKPTRKRCAPGMTQRSLPSAYFLTAQDSRSKDQKLPAAQCDNVRPSDCDAEGYLCKQISVTRLLDTFASGSAPARGPKISSTIEEIPVQDVLQSARIHQERGVKRGQNGVRDIYNVKGVDRLLKNGVHHTTKHPAPI